MTPKEKALERVRKLIALAEDSAATEGEIENAMKFAQKLMSEHDIEFADVELSPDDITEIEQEFSPANGERKYWLQDLLNIISESQNCTVVKFQKANPERTKLIEYFRIFGTKTEVKISQEMYIKMIPIIRNLVSSFYKEKCNRDLKHQAEFRLPLTIPNKGKFFNDYIDGFLHGLRSKCLVNKKQLIKEDESGKYGLIVVKKDALVQSYVTSNYKIKMGSANKKRNGVDAETFIKGFQDGKTEHSNKIA